MRRIKIEMIIGTIGCLIMGGTLIGIVLFNYRAFTTLPPFPVSQKAIETLKAIVINDMKFIALIGAIWVLFGWAFLRIYLRLKRHAPAA
jgi:uncharacterized membrane protein